ncbi:hypothetical protein CQW23_35459 [Capsicum baccatum]|uniref:Uncharacterized protein n=1 Tax=Capsicum baccatum TaxID=33114 RepID=A0A2G2UVY1_CAPBA|nr:hypothetical protein CQW23_35459 [Capsicum baccatum]
MALGDLMESRFSQSSAALDEFGNEDGDKSSNVRESDTASSSYLGGAGTGFAADNAMTTTTSMAYFPQTIVLCELRHDGFEDCVPSGPSDTGLVSKWRPRDRKYLLWCAKVKLKLVFILDVNLGC